VTSSGYYPNNEDVGNIAALRAFLMHEEYDNRPEWMKSLGLAHVHVVEFDRVSETEKIRPYTKKVVHKLVRYDINIASAAMHEAGLQNIPSKWMSFDEEPTEAYIAKHGQEIPPETIKHVRDRSSCD
jgi:hypothetical protein